MKNWTLIWSASLAELFQLQNKQLPLLKMQSYGLYLLSNSAEGLVNLEVVICVELNVLMLYWFR